MHQHLRRPHEEIVIAAAGATFTPEVMVLSHGEGVDVRLAHVPVQGYHGHVLPTRRLVSWAGLGPGQHQRDGKQRSGRTRKGSPWLRTALGEADRSAERTQTYLDALYRRLAARRGSGRAAIAVAHAMLEIIYHLLARNEGYQELGVEYLAVRDRETVQRRLVKRLERLGYDVVAQPRAG